VAEEESALMRPTDFMSIYSWIILQKNNGDKCPFLFINKHEPLEKRYMYGFKRHLVIPD
jgi:hypothetical protein